MIAQTATTKLTYDDLLGFPEDDGLRHELIDGGHLVTPAPHTRHQDILAELLLALRSHARDHGLGKVLPAPVDVVLSDVDVVQPDLLFLMAARSDRLTVKNLRGAPDLVVEIVSESTRRRDEMTKRHLYQQHGVGEYWVVDPVIDTVKVYRLGAEGVYERVAELSAEDEAVLTSPLFPGLEISLVELFA
jgi:Uma2 family endonuclease